MNLQNETFGGSTMINQTSTNAIPQRITVDVGV